MTQRTFHPTYKSALRVWWAFVWRTALWVFLLTIPFAVILGIAAALKLAAPQDVELAVSLIWIPILCAAQIEAFRRILRLDFPKYSVRLIDNAPSKEKSHE